MFQSDWSVKEAAATQKAVVHIGQPLPSRTIEPRSFVILWHTAIKQRSYLHIWLDGALYKELKRDQGLSFDPSEP